MSISFLGNSTGTAFSDPQQLSSTNRALQQSKAPAEGFTLPQDVREELDKVLEKDNIRYGLLGDENCDLYYVPPQILEKMPKYVPVGSKADDFQNSSSEVSHAWNEYYKVLNDFGINHNDPDSLAQIFIDENLRNTINMAFEEVLK